MNRGVYDDDDSENDGDGGRWSTGTDESDSIMDNTRNVTSNETISENLKTDGQDNRKRPESLHPIC